MGRVAGISEMHIQNWVGARSFQKGYKYFEDESILNPRRRGSSLVAECQGTQAVPYRVEIRLGPEGIIEGACTCSAGAGGHCKHAAALLLTWLHEPEMFVDVPEIEQLLEKRSRADLIALIQQMVIRYPDLEQMLELSELTSLSPGEPVPANRIAQQVHWAFSSAGGEMGGDNAQVAQNLQPILDMGEALIDREDIENAATVYRTLIDNMLTYEDCLYHDEGGDLGQVLAECEQSIEECLHSTRDAHLRSKLLRSLFDLLLWDLQAGGLGYADETPNILTTLSTSEEKLDIAAWVQAALPSKDDWQSDRYKRELGGLWLGLMSENMDDETYLSICAATGRTRDMADRLLSLGRVEEALATARAAGAREITHFADIFETHGYAELAAQLVKEQPGSETEIHLLKWLKQYALLNDQPDEAMRLAGQIFWQAQTLEHYNALLEAAETVGAREAERQQVLERLESAGNFFLLVEIYLHENEVDLALAALERVNPDIWWGRMALLRRQVAQAVEAPRPREAIRQYLLLAEELIRKRSRGNYAEAARLLLHVHKLYRGLGEEERWVQILDGLRQDYRRLPAFMDEMRLAGLLT